MIGLRILVCLNLLICPPMVLTLFNVRMQKKAKNKKTHTRRTVVAKDLVFRRSNCVPNESSLEEEPERAGDTFVVEVKVAYVVERGE